MKSLTMKELKPIFILMFSILSHIFISVDLVKFRFNLLGDDLN